MKRITGSLALVSAGALMLLGGCASETERDPYYDQGATTYEWEVDEQATAPQPQDEVATTDEWGGGDVAQQAQQAQQAEQPQSVAVTLIQPTQGNDVSGEIRFEAMQSGDVKMITDLQNLQPNKEYVVLLGGRAAPGQQPTHQDAEVLGFVKADELGQGYVERTVEILGVGDDIEEPISDHVLFVSPIERGDEATTGTLPAGAPREGGELSQDDRSLIGEPVGMGEAEQY